MVCVLAAGCGGGEDESFEEIAPGIAAVTAIDDATPDEDLRALRPIIGDARFVGLGESVHTVGTYYTAKARVFRWLVEHEGFRAFGFETPWLGAKGLAMDVAGGCPGGDAAIGASMADGLFGVWVSEESRATFRFMCDWNAAHPDDRVVFYGFDAQSPFEEGPRVLDALTMLLPARAAELRPGIERCDGTTLTQLEYFQRFYDETGGRRSVALDGVAHAACLDAIDAAEQALTTDRAALAAAHGERAVVEAMLAVHALRASEGEAWYDASGTWSGGEPDDEASFESRDTFMAEALVALADLEAPGARVAIWAHNTHLARHHDEVTGPPYAGVTTMGTFAHDTLGDDWRPIALLAEDEVVNWPGLESGSLGPQPEDALETSLGALGAPALIVDLARQEIVAGDAMVPTYREQMAPARQFAGALFFKATAGMTLL